MSGEEVVISRDEGFKKCFFDGASKIVYGNVKGRNVAWIEPSANSTVTAITIYKLSASSTPAVGDTAAVDVWLTTGITITVTAGQFTRLPDLGDGYAWGRFKILATAPGNPAATEWIALHFGS